MVIQDLNNVRVYSFYMVGTLFLFCGLRFSYYLCSASNKQIRVMKIIKYFKEKFDSLFASKGDGVVLVVPYLEKSKYLYTVRFGEYVSEYCVMFHFYSLEDGSIVYDRVPYPEHHREETKERFDNYYLPWIGRICEEIRDKGYCTKQELQDFILSIERGWIKISYYGFV